MYESSFALRARLFTVIAVLATSAAVAQNPPAAVSQPPAPGQTQADPAKSENDAMLAKAGALYYSTTRLGLSGFTCTIHPDWYTLFVSARKGDTITTVSYTHLTLP